MDKFFSEKTKVYAPAVLRVGLSLVILWFGSQQLMDASKWIKIIPEWATSISGMSPYVLVYFNGTFEIIFGLCLLVGFQTRIVSLLLSLHMLLITITVGYSATGVRDFGLAMAAISSFLYGVDNLSLDKYLENK